jgi:hypothetical protein
MEALCASQTSETLIIRKQCKDTRNFYSYGYEGFCLLGCNAKQHPEIGTISIDWAQLNRFHLKTETQSSLRNAVYCNINRKVFLDKDRTMDNVQKHNIYT